MQHLNNYYTENRASNDFIGNGNGNGGESNEHEEIPSTNITDATQIPAVPANYSCY